MLNNILEKSFGEYILIILIALLFIILYFILNVIYSNKNQNQNENQNENMMMIPNTTAYWNRNECPFNMNNIMMDELKTNGFEYSNNNWNVYFPCGYDEITKEVNKMPIVNGGKYFILENCDEIVAKERLWKNVLLHHGIEKAKLLLPNSYILYDLKDLTKFKNEFLEEQKRLTIEGNIVISVGLFGHSGDDEVWDYDTKEMLDAMHKRKIDLADEIFVINVGGYIGESTKSEIEYAKNNYKTINYLEN